MRWPSVSGKRDYHIQNLCPRWVRYRSWSVWQCSRNATFVFVLSYTQAVDLLCFRAHYMCMSVLKNKGKLGVVEQRRSYQVGTNRNIVSDSKRASAWYHRVLYPLLEASCFHLDNLGGWNHLGEWVHLYRLGVNKLRHCAIKGGLERKSWSSQSTWNGISK